MEHDLLNAYYIIDECHNFFDNQDKIKMWWLTYHRHLNHEILFITQNKSLINTQYRNIPEIFIKALPRSKAISKNTLRYNHYTEYRMINKFSTTEITVNPTYFDLYTSGNVSNQKRVGLKYLIMFLVFIVFFFVAFGYFAYKMMSESDTKIQENKTLEVIPPVQNLQPFKNNLNSFNEIQEDNEDENLKLFKFNCFDTLCYYKIDNKTTLEIPQNILKTYLLNIDINKKFTDLKNNRLVIYVLVDENKFKFLEKGVTHENDNQQINPNLFTDSLSK